MIGSNIKKLRLEKGLTQKKLADMLFVSAQAVSRWENNEVEPSIGTIAEMAKIFGVSSDEILGIESEEKEIPQKSAETEKEYVYREVPKTVLALCSCCNRPLYEVSEIVRRKGNIYCRDCARVKSEAAVRQAEKRMAEEKAKSLGKARKRRILSFIFGGLAAVAAAFIWYYADLLVNAQNIAICILSSISMFTLVSCCILDNNFILDMEIEILQWGAVKFPGVIFSLDIDGCLFFIGVKLLFGILSFLIGLAVFLIALFIGGIISVFVYPYAIYKNIKYLA